MIRYLFVIILGFDIAILLFQTFQLSISYDEAYLIYYDSSFLHYLINFSLYIFGENDFALRLPMIMLHIGSVLFLYKISKHYILDIKDRLYLVVIYILLPGVMSSGIVVNIAGVLLFGLLLYIYMYKNNFKYITYILMLFYSLVDGSFLYLFVGVFFDGIYKKELKQVLFSVVSFFISIYLYGIEAYGAPKGHFLDFIGIYSAIFSPIIFIYIVYVLYRVYFMQRKDLDILWFLAVNAFLISLILSFRQRVAIEHFAPYIIVALPLIAKVFILSYKIRLKMFRKWYKTIFIVSFIFLILNGIIVLSNKYLYIFIENPKNNFAYNMHIAKELSMEFKEYNTTCTNLDETMMLRLKFYGIGRCKDKTDLKDVTLSYNGVIVYKTDVTKINSQ